MHQSVQGRRLYDWEKKFVPVRLRRQKSIKLLRQLAHVVASFHKMPTPTIVAGSGVKGGAGSWYSYTQGDKIVLARHHRDVHTLIHEMAHYIQGNIGWSHGPAYVKQLIVLLSQFGDLDSNELTFTAIMWGIKC